MDPVGKGGAHRNAAARGWRWRISGILMRVQKSRCRNRSGLCFHDQRLPKSGDCKSFRQIRFESLRMVRRKCGQFVPGSKYQYSSMAILLAARVAERISGTDIGTLVERAVFQPLQMQHSAQGLGQFKLENMVWLQTEHAAPESGGGDPNAKELGLEQSLVAQIRCPLGRHSCLGDGRR